MSLYHSDKKIEQLTVRELYDEKIKPLEEAVVKLDSEVKKLQTEGMGSISYDKTKKEFEELMTKAISQVTFEGGLTGKDYLNGNKDMKCSYCEKKVNVNGCKPYAERRKDIVVFGRYCNCSNNFDIQGKLPIPKLILEFLGEDTQKLTQSRQEW